MNVPVEPSRILIGDTIEQMGTLPEKCVQCCVTSPPYWGLRNYNVDGQIGLEETPEQFVQKMVEVGRAVHRVLRDDGTFWLNLGSSYASGGTSPSRSRSDAPAYGSDGKPLRGSQSAGRACPYCGGELQDGSSIRRDYTARICQRTAPARPLGETTIRDIEQTGSTSESASSFDARPSTNRASRRRVLDACDPSTTPSADPSATSTSSGCAPMSARNSACTSGTAKIDHPLANHTSGTGFFCTACGYCTTTYPVFKPKDLVNIPFMVAEALRADGWWLRSVIVWAKKSPMPESCTDRPTSSWEPIFLLTKSERYFYDADAVKQESVSGGQPTKYGKGNGGRALSMGREPSGNEHPDAKPVIPTFRNQRNVWHLGPEPYSEAHFATFPTEIPRRAIKAGTSEKGCCPACGAPWTRIIDKTKITRERPNDFTKRSGEEGTGNSCANSVAGVATKTIGWEPGCECDAGDPVPCLVLDPFLGSGTTVAVARELGRHGVGCELNPEYAKLAAQRIGKAERPETYRDDTKVTDAPLFAKT